MKKIILYTTIFILSISFLSVNAQFREYSSDTLSMDPFYALDIFYSMSEGEITSVAREGWDIAFYTSAFSAGIIINEGSGVQLFNYPIGDTSDWDNIDTTGLQAWIPIYNNPEYWEEGAFNKNATGHPDYGWGIYNMVTHSLTGDSLYIINLPDVGYKKLWIVNKISTLNVYNIRYADLDGSNEQLVEIDIKPYTDKNFIYYSMSSDAVVDREPDSDWDLLFTKYIDFTEDNSGNMVEYLVTGATSNINHYANKFSPVGDDFVNWASQPFDSLKNVVGYNWKDYGGPSTGWIVEDSTAFFIMDKQGDVFKLVFTYWEGMMTGTFAFNKEQIHVSSIEDSKSVINTLAVYPNPASDMVNISVAGEHEFIGNIKITDFSGRIVHSSDIGKSDGSKVSVNTGNFVKGLYFITLYCDDFKATQKLILK